PESYMKEDLWRYAMAGWVYKDWQGARNWLEGLEGEKRDEMIELVYRAWAARERGEAEAWRNSVKGRDEE
ncbi:MAG: hypothetical protein ABF391_15795, partial [Akkermansiaceae bacterium]